MALLRIAGILLGVVCFAFLSTSFGHRLFRVLFPEAVPDGECLLCSSGIGVVVAQVLIFFTEITNHIRAGLLTVLIVAILIASRDFLPVLRKIRGVSERLLGASKIEKLLIAAIVLVGLVEFVAAMAPLTGSDALHYHFAAPSMILREGFHPNLFLSHSFFCGQSHLLILACLALGSERLAMGLLFLGGFLSVGATVSLARQWMNSRWAWVTALLFFLTPLVFWQICSAGAPDLWMSFFTVMGVMVISKARETSSWRHALLAGIFAGGVAGVKYTGCFVAAALAIAFLAEVRSLQKAVVFVTSALLGGVWPYARNLVWTGDPFFPFLLPRLSPDHVNAYALAAYRADTGAVGSRTLLQIIEFIAFSWIDPARVGFWQFFGPLVLAFLPLLVLAVRNTSIWRTAMTVWILSAFGIGFTSSMTRFLLPVFPIALAAAVAGVAALESKPWKLLRMVSVSSIVLFLLLGVAGLMAYTKAAVTVSLGLASREDYLRANAPEYQAAEFVNQTLRNLPKDRKALVFMRHVYFLHVPFAHGNPTSSWWVDPSALKTPEQWKSFFQANAIEWVVKSPKYPPALAASLDNLEAQGDLIPFAQAEVEGFQGNRILGVRARIGSGVI